MRYRYPNWKASIDNGMGFDGSSVQGYARIDESDMMSVPDLDTFQLLPWRPREDVASGQNDLRYL